jgi:glycosyltransferase involved in cell wall biosynthesis
VRHRLLVDLQATQSQAHADRGIARYVKEQTRAMVRRGVGDALLLNPHLPFPRHLDQDLLTHPGLRWNTQTEVRRLVEAEPDRPIAYYLTSPFELSLRAEGDLPAHLWRGSVPVVATLYDLIPLVMPERYLRDEAIGHHYRGRVEQLHQVDLVLCISEHTRLDAIRLLGLDPTKVKSIGFGVSPFFHPESPTDGNDALLARHLPAVDRPFVLTVLGGDPRKNAERLFAAYAASGVEHLLVVTCNLDPGTRAAWELAAKEVGLVVDRDIVFTGWQSDEVLRALYQRCELFVFPPLYEGAGLPAAEAVACGAPTITSSTSSVPEVLELPEATFDPESIDDMARLITRGLADDDFRARLRSRGEERTPLLTWDHVAARTIDALDELPDLGPTTLPWRVALVGPMPPNESGIADYNAQLLPELAKRCELDVFTPTSWTGAPIDDVRWFPPRALKDTCSPWSYDAVVYTVGNSDDHHDLYELAQEFPGLLWMHDVRLPGLLTTYAEERVAPKTQFLQHRLLQQYRRRLPIHLREDPHLPTFEYIAAGIGLTKELVDVARGVVVSSELAARLVRLDQQPDAATTPTWVVPHAFPAPTPDAGARELHSLVSMGMVSPLKGSELLVGAVGALHAQGVEATLTFVGPVDDAYREHLESLATSLGVGDRVRITGRADEATYQRWMRSATLAVQLRQTTNGESSGAIAGAMSAGLPVVTNAHAARELPDGTVSLVPWDIDARDLAAHLARLLDDPAERRTIAAAARSHAQTWAFADVAARLMELVKSLP